MKKLLFFQIVKTAKQSFSRNTYATSILRSFQAFPSWSAFIFNALRQVFLPKKSRSTSVLKLTIEPSHSHNMCSQSNSQHSKYSTKKMAGRYESSDKTILSIDQKTIGLSDIMLGKRKAMDDLATQIHGLSFAHGLDFIKHPFHKLLAF